MARIKKVWPKCASNVNEIRKAMKEFMRRLEAVKELNKSSNKLHFGESVRFDLLFRLYIGQNFEICRTL